MKRINKIKILRITRQKGFTLVEIFIVGVLIALFAGMAIFNIQEVFKQNLRKACIADVRQVGTALSFAKQDIDFFPRICFLELSLKGLLDKVYNLNHIHSMGFANTQLSARTAIDWKGAYFASSLSRNRISQGRGGVVTMICPDTFPGPGMRSNPPRFDWPADPWERPYVLYIIKNQQKGEQFIPAFITDPMEEGDRLTAVVSYGPNKVPGGSETQTTPTQTQREERLFRDSTEPRVFINLIITEYNSQRANAINKNLPDIGILDRNSDDLIYEF